MLFLSSLKASFAGELQRDRDTLLQQVMTLEKNLDTFRTENDNLKKELKGGRVSSFTNQLTIIIIIIIITLEYLCKQERGREEERERGAKENIALLEVDIF